MQLYEFLSELNRTEKYRGMTICPPNNFKTVYALSAVTITFRKLDETAGFLKVKTVTVACLLLTIKIPRGEIIEALKANQPCRRNVGWRQEK